MVWIGGGSARVTVGGLPGDLPTMRDGTIALPDLTDPATLGCLLALVREAWGTEYVHARKSERGWEVCRGSSEWYHGETEAEALVAALEEAP